MGLFKFPKWNVPSSFALFPKTQFVKYPSNRTIKVTERPSGVECAGFKANYNNKFK